MAAIKIKTTRSENPVNELGEIDLFGTQAAVEDNFALGLITRFDAYFCEDPDWAWSVAVRLKRAFLQLTCRGCVVDQEGRAGDAPSLQYIETKEIHNEVNETIQKSHVGGKINLSLKPKAVSADIAADAGGRIQKERKLRLENKSNLDKRRDSLRAIPGNRWIVEDLVTDALNGRYSPEDHLCNITVISEKSASISAYLYFMPRDISISYTKSEDSSFFSFNQKPNAAAVIKALIAKRLKSLEKKQLGDGKIVIGTSLVSCERPNL